MRLFKKELKEPVSEKTETEKLMELIDLLKKVLIEIENEKNNPTLWRPTLLKNVVEPEILEILEHAENGEIFFKYGSDQRRLETDYFISDSIEPLHLTKLGCSIDEFEKVYYKL